MKKLHFFSLLALVLALGVAFIACSSNSDSDDSVDGSFTITGIIEGQDVEAIISKSSKAAYNIATGDYYIIRFVDGDVISRGTIEWEDPMVRFIPDDGSDPFYGYYTAGTLEINDVPYGTGTYKLGGQAPGTASRFYPNLGPSSPWTNFTRAQTILSDAYNDALTEALKDTTLTTAQAVDKAKEAVKEMIDDYDELVREKMGNEQIKNWVADTDALGGIVTHYPQYSSPEYYENFIYYIVSETNSATTFDIQPPDMSLTSTPHTDWTTSGTPPDPSAGNTSATAWQTIMYEFDAIDDGNGGYVVHVEYTLHFIAVALFEVTWDKGTEAGKLSINYMSINIPAKPQTDALTFGMKNSSIYWHTGGVWMDLVGSGLEFEVKDKGGTSQVANAKSWGTEALPETIDSQVYTITVSKP